MSGSTSGAIVSPHTDPAELAAERDDDDDLELACKLVELWGADTLAYFALRDDKRFFFCSNRRAMVAYASYAGCLLASGDPIGDPDSLARVVREFVAFAHAQGRRVAFLAVSDATLPTLRALGLCDFYYGDEAVLDCTEFSLAGSARRPIRLPNTQLIKRGDRFELVEECRCDAATLAEVEAVRASQHGAGELTGFTMGLDRGITGREPGLLLALARTPEGVLEAFLRLAPCSGRVSTYTLDMMRRLPDSANGVHEFLIAQTALALREAGAELLSLNFSVYRRYFAEPGEMGPRERWARWLLTRFEWLLPIRSLVRWNEKFAPNWLARYIVHERGQLLRTIVLYVIAEGFFRLPGIGRLALPSVRKHWTAVA
jgi:lysylphosphatidylglycerol synthetase-like protein (DUF2156 family)